MEPLENRKDKRERRSFNVFTKSARGLAQSKSCACTVARPVVGTFWTAAPMHRDRFEPSARVLSKIRLWRIIVSLSIRMSYAYNIKH